MSSAGTADPNSSDTIAYSWNWGDGTALSTGASPSAHVYAAPGSYVITLTTTDGWGDAASTTRNATLTEPPGNQPPSATFTSNCPTYTTCTFNSAGTVDPDGDVPIRYAWTFGDGGTSTSANPSRTYAAPGTYTVSLTTTDVWGRFSTVTHDVTMTEPAGNQGPVATFVATCTALACAMNSTGTVDPEGHTIKGYSWNWGDGTALSTGASPSHTYAVPGMYTITLTVTDSWNRAGAPATRDVNLTEPAGNTGPNATFVATCTILTCAMNSAGTVDPQGDAIRSYSWNWGDGTALSTGASPSHTYTLPGTYTITLTVVDAWNRAGTPVTRDVTMTEPAGNQAPSVVFTTSCTTFTTCVMNSTGTADPEANTPLRYSWNWGDATAVSTTASPSHVYTFAGTYTVTLTVSDAWGRAAAPVSHDVTTLAEPGGNTGPTVTFPQPVCTGLSCAVSSTGTADPDGIRSYSWNWGDATTVSTGASPAAHVYAAAGTYTITLIVTDNWGRTSTQARTVTVS